MEYITITGHINIETARKDYTIEGLPYTGNQDVSEWAMAITLARYQVGDQVPIAEFEEQLHLAIVAQTLQSLEEKGIIESSWSEEHGDVVYNLTTEGKKLYES